MYIRNCLKGLAFAVVIFVAFMVVVALNGCASTKADQFQAEHGQFNKTTIETVAGQSNTLTNELAKIAFDKQIELLRRDDEREQEVARTMEKALESRDNYWMGVIAADQWYNVQVAKAGSYQKALGEAAKGFDQQAQMTALSATIPQKLAADSLSAAINAAPAIYSAFAPTAAPPSAPTPSTPPEEVPMTPSISPK